MTALSVSVQDSSFSLIEQRIIQSLWSKKSVQYIANMLGRGFKETEDQVQQMAKVQKVILYQPPTFERKIKRRDQEEKWAKGQLAAKKEIRISDHSGLISVRLDHKTIVQVKPGTDIEALRERYRKVSKRVWEK